MTGETFSLLPLLDLLSTLAIATFSDSSPYINYYAGQFLSLDSSSNLALSSDTSSSSE